MSSNFVEWLQLNLTILILFEILIDFSYASLILLKPAALIHYRLVDLLLLSAIAYRWYLILVKMKRILLTTNLVRTAADFDFNIFLLKKKLVN